MKKLILFILILLPLLAFSYPKTPRIWSESGHLCTVSDKDFSYLRYKEGIPYCERNVSYSRRQEIYDRYGIPKEERKDYTIDHIIPLSLGGSNHNKNLWPQHKSIYTGHLEYWLYKKMEEASWRQVETVHYIISHKFNPMNKDHVPYPPK